MTLLTIVVASLLSNESLVTYRPLPSEAQIRGPYDSGQFVVFSNETIIVLDKEFNTKFTTIRESSGLPTLVDGEIRYAFAVVQDVSGSSTSLRWICDDYGLPKFGWAPGGVLVVRYEGRESTYTVSGGVRPVAIHRSGSVFVYSGPSTITMHDRSNGIPAPLATTLAGGETVTVAPAENFVAIDANRVAFIGIPTRKPASSVGAPTIDLRTRSGEAEWQADAEERWVCVADFKRRSASVHLILKQTVSRSKAVVDTDGMTSHLRFREADSSLVYVYGPNLVRVQLPPRSP